MFHAKSGLSGGEGPGVSGDKGTDSPAIFQDACLLKQLKRSGHRVGVDLQSHGEIPNAGNAVPGLPFAGEDSLLQKP